MGEEPFDVMTPDVPTSGFLARRQFKLRFSDISEFFLSRAILLKSPNQKATAEVEVEFSLLDLFPKYDNLAALSDYLIGKTLTLSDRPTELVSDLVSLLSGIKIDAAAREESAIEYFNAHLERRLHFLAHGDSSDLKPCIRKFAVETTAPLHRYRVRFTPRVLAAVSSENLTMFLNIAQVMLRKIAHKMDRTDPRVDYRKQLEMLVSFLENRRDTTGETEFSFESRDFAFRHAVLYTDDRFTLPSPGTTGASERILLPLFLETNGDLDLTGLSISSDPLEVHDVVVRYSIARPSITNAFEVMVQGLTPELRSALNEHELQVYDRLNRYLSKRYVFGGKPVLEASFAELCCWLIRKVAYCLEEPSFLRDKAIAWLHQHRDDKYRKFEDDFFLPSVYERLREHFGSRIIKKPEQFRGEVDILFDTAIPIELKVIESKGNPAEDAVNEKFPGEGQAAAYASISRLGLVLLLNVAEGQEKITNLEHCVSVTERAFDGDQNLPTCIVVLVFHCHHPKPSSVS